ncbi:MAG: Tad domain-containing protein [Bacteriovoracaceae bacterium]
MTKRTGEQGQISIFFSASLVVLVSIVAFVINVGLFVKAKINLQNATDASAFAGAAVQSRQLTNIAYLNWEMRNIFKEWMFKYYVIGNLNIPDVMTASPGASGMMSFRLEPDVDVLAQAGTEAASVADPYNFPSVCIHLSGASTNICRRYAIPGLPEFGSSSLPGAEEASRAFQDILVEEKTKDCNERTTLNMLVALTWAYNILPSSDADPLTGQGPAIMAHRQGAWPRAVELAMRIRNLEKIVNRETVAGESICISPGATDKINCVKQVDDLATEALAGNERLIKAFYSGYRNIGGNYENDEMKISYTMTEIPPQMVEASTLGSANSASYLLSNEYPKQYLDLKLQMVNYAPFFSAMIPRATERASGACDASKVALPVPGYPLGFYKNPQIVTYYAVKGESVFEGMFNPFQDSIKLTAYAAAKPMGGRIGPMLFYQDQATNTSRPRTDGNKRRSVPYLTSLDVVGTRVRKGNSFGTLNIDEYWPGVPLPVNSSASAFWINGEGKPVGGIITDGEGVQFGIPNLVYDFEEPFDSRPYAPASVPLHIVQTRMGPIADAAVGLFSKHQFGKFKGNALGTNVSVTAMEEELARIKAPTSYEAANYLIPTPDEVNKSFNPKLDSFGLITTKKNTLSNGVQQYSAHLYAPLYDPDLKDVHWNTSAQVVSAIRDFMRFQMSGMDKYRNALNQAAKAIYDQRNYVQAAALGSEPAYINAAKGISDIDFTGPMNQNPQSCGSLNGKFRFFYYGSESGVNPSGCTFEPIEILLDKYFSQHSTDPNFTPSHYYLEYNWYEANFAGTPQNRKTVFSAYVPGTYTGIGHDGVFTSPIPGSSLSETMRRNFYSTKFISIDSLKEGYNESTSKFLIFSEGDTNSTNLQVQQRGYLNPLQPLLIGSDDLSSIKH